MAIFLLMKMCVTSVLCIRKGNHVSVRAEPLLQSFTQIHRLGLAVIKQYPDVKQRIERHMTAFCSLGEDGNYWRHKNQSPNLGTYFFLQFLQHKIPMSDFVTAYVTESMDRSVLWRCREF